MQDDVPETGSHRECMPSARDERMNGHGPGGTYGVIKEISVLDPLPGVVGLLSVVSISVQPSPLSPHDPFPSWHSKLISIW